MKDEAGVVPVSIRPLKPPEARGVKDDNPEQHLNRPNLLIKLWTRSPVPFRTAFLATLGVVSALWMAWYAVGFKGWLARPRAEQSAMTRSASDVDLAPPVSGKGREPEYIAVGYVLQEKIGALVAIQGVRAGGWNNALREDNVYVFLNVLAITRPELEDLYVSTHRLRMPEGKVFAEVYNRVLNAIDAEYAFQKALLRALDEPDSLRNMAVLQTRGEAAIQLAETAMVGVAALFMAIDENVAPTMTAIYGAD
ncbi:MAG: hypothetical protein KAT00_07335 [Planctomycetes bacterium]|nr:hypothetical protein [Planctomycetota bacterium]